MRTVELKIYQFNELSESAKQKAIDDERRYLQEEGFWYLQDEAQQSYKAFNNLFNQRIPYKLRTIIPFDLTGIRLAKYIWNNFKNEIFSRKYYDHLKTERQIFHPCVKSTELSCAPGRWSSAYYSNITLTSDCPLTGTHWDHSLLGPIYEFLEHPDTRNLQNLVNESVENLEDALDTEIEYFLSNEHIAESLVDMEYEFLSNGERFWDN